MGKAFYAAAFLSCILFTVCLILSLTDEYNPDKRAMSHIARRLRFWRTVETYARQEIIAATAEFDRIADRTI